jgi:N-hydroxyarylamine O-acetyltransferase
VRIESYLERIGYEGSVKPDLDCLKKIHLQQALSVPYENLDIQLERPVDQDVERIFDKIVRNRRGGWCYELNGILHWVLEEIGFDVSRCVAGVLRSERGDSILGNHLILLVQLDDLYLADLGLGDGIREPVPIKPGSYVQGELVFRLEKLNDGFWRFHNHGFGDPTQFDFKTIPANEQLLTDKCHSLQHDATSVFVQNLACQIMTTNSVTCLTGQVLGHKTSEGTTKKLLNSAEELENTLVKVFGIRDPDTRSVWSRVRHRHIELFGEKSIDEIDLAGF